MRKFIIALTFAMAVAPAHAGKHLNTIDDIATLHDSGRLVAVGGPIGCPKGELIEIRVLLSRGGVAIGEGAFSTICSGGQERWHAVAESWGGPAETGAGDAHAWAKTWDGDQLTKSWDWGKQIELRPAAVETAGAD